MSSAFDFTPEQREAIEHDKGPCLVLAGPGSGKTRVLTHRIIRLLKRGVPPQRILAVTFTRHAANEMRRRVAEAVGEETANKIGISTLHAWAYRFLRQNGGLKPILEDDEIKRVVRYILRKMRMNTDEETVEEVRTDLTRFAGSLQPLDLFQPESCASNVFSKIVKYYREFKEKKGVMDLDDLLLFSYDILSRDVYLRKALQESIDYVLVDEFQDINPVQWELIRFLVGPDENLYVVGDEDQSIYAFRGASPQIMIEFPEEFPKTKRILLGRNFRSRAAIVEAATRLISKNKQRFDKQLVANREGGRSPVVLRPANARDEAEAVLTQILTDLKMPDVTIGVLYRTNLSAITLIHLLEEANIPFQILGGRPSIFNRWMVQDCLSWIRWAWGKATVDEVLRLLRRPLPRGLNLRVLKQIPGDLGKPDDVMDWLSREGYGVQVAMLRRKLDELRKKKANLTIGFIRSELEYDRFVKEYSARFGTDEAAIFEILDYLSNMADPNADSRHFLVMAERERKKVSVENKSENVRVTLSTFHSSKGLEWNYVYILNAVDGVTPNKRACSSKVLGHLAMEEERRLFYVAMTRARDQLTIFAPTTSGSKNLSPSPFIQEAGLGDSSSDGLTTGTAVVQHTFGEGTVLDVKEDVVTSNSGGVIRRIMRSFFKL